MSEMSDEYKTRDELIEELQRLREQVAEHEAARREPELVRGAFLEERYLSQALMESSLDHVFLKDRDSRFIKVNRAKAQLLGVTHPQEAIGRTDFDFFPHQYAQRYYDEEQEIMESGQPVFESERAIPNREGETLWFSEHKIPVRDQAGQIVGVVGIAREVTERRRAQEALQEANYALQRRAIHFEASAAVSRAIASIFDVDQLLRQTVNLIRDRFGFYHAGIFLLDDTGDWAVLREATGDAGAEMRAQGHRLEVADTSMVGWTALHRLPRIALDVGEDAVRFANPLLPYTRSEMALPLMVGERMLGVLNVQSTEEAAFDEDDVRALQSMADQVAVAIENARRVSDEASMLEAASPVYRASRLLTTATETDDVADAIIASVAETGADGCLVVEFGISPQDEPIDLLYLGVWRRDREPNFETGTRIPFSESPFPVDMVSTLWVVPDVDQDERLPESARKVFRETDVRALVNIPLLSGERVIGQVVVLRSTAGEFPESALQLYETLSAQAAVALERAQLLAEAQKRAVQEQTTRYMVDRIRRAVDVQQALKTAATELSEALGVPHVSVELELPGSVTQEQ